MRRAGILATMHRALIFLLLLEVLPLDSAAQRVRYDVPEGLGVEIPEADYHLLVDSSVAVVKRYCAVKEVSNGTIHLKRGAPFIALNLDNLLLSCLDIPDRTEWPALIREHFHRAFTDIKAQQELDMTAYEAVKPYLTLRVYNAGYLARDASRPPVVSTTHLEGTSSVLMLDMPSTFQTVEPGAFEKWNRPKEEVFHDARRNVEGQPMEIVTTMLGTPTGDSISVTFIENADYAASYVLGIGDTHPELIGKWGAAIAIPNKGLAMLCGIGPDLPLDFIHFIETVLGPMQELFAQHAYPVSDRFYWYYNGRFTPFTIEVSATGALNVIAPVELSSLLAGSK